VPCEMALQLTSPLKFSLPPAPWAGLEPSSLASIGLPARSLRQKGLGSTRSSTCLVWESGQCLGRLVDCYSLEAPGLAGIIAGTTPAPQKRYALAGQETQAVATLVLTLLSDAVDQAHGIH
jgi:hypothetical protein